MLASLVPLFNTRMDVHGYFVLAQRENFLLDAAHATSSRFDNANQIEGFEIIEGMGIATLSSDRELFVPVNNVALFSDLSRQFSGAHDHIVLVIDNGVEPTPMYIQRLHDLQMNGFRIGMQHLPLNRIKDYSVVLALCDYLFLDCHRVDITKAKSYFLRNLPQLMLCAISVDTQEKYNELKELGGFHLFAGKFFRLPPVPMGEELSPLKATYLELIRVVNQEDYDLITAADVLGQDPVLVVSLLKIVNRMTINNGITSVRHAAAILGQRELKRWINTAITKELCADKPSEITRLSMLRARFAENLAPVFGMSMYSGDLFLMGLFSVLDIMLDEPIDKALQRVRVSMNIYNALVSGTGIFSPVYHFMKEYETASWQEVSRMMILLNLDMDVIYEAYLNSLRWYRDLITA